MSDSDNDSMHEIEIPDKKPPSDGQQGSQNGQIKSPQAEDQSYHNQVDEQEAQDQNSDEEIAQVPEQQPLVVVNKKVKYNGPPSIQQAQAQLEQQNKSSLEGAIRLRSVWRILNLFVITTLLITGFYYIYVFLCEFQGITPIPENANIFLNVTNCKIVIIDQVQLTEIKTSNFSNVEASNFSKIKGKNDSSSNNVNKTQFESEYYEHLLQEGKSESSSQKKSLRSSQSSESSDQDDKQENGTIKTSGLLLFYNIPGRFNIDPTKKTSTMTKKIKGSDFNFQFHNILSPESCMIEIHVPKETLVNNLTINCNTNCYIMLLTKNLVFNTINITADDKIEFNAPVLQTKNLSFRGISGRFQTMYLDFQQFADIRLENGDIAIQTKKEVMVNFTHANPNFCLGSPFVANPIIIGCEIPAPAEVSAYISGVGKGQSSKKKPVANKSSEHSGSSSSSGHSSSSSGSSSKSDSSSSSTAVENFYEDEDPDNGNIGLIEGFSTYGRSKKFQHEIEPSTNSNSKSSDSKDSKDSKGSSIDSEGSSSNSSAKTFNSKTTQAKKEAVLLFQPNCFGNFLLCQTRNCSTLVAGLKAINDSTLNFSSSSPDAVPIVSNTSASSNSLGSNNGSQSSKLYRVLENQGKIWLQGDSIASRQLASKKSKHQAVNGSSSSSSKQSSSNHSGSSSNSSANNTATNETQKENQYEAEAELDLPHKIPKGIPFLNLTGRFGNLFVNVISSQNQLVQVNDTIIHGANYANETIDFSIPARKVLSQYFKKVADPHNFDPTFIIQIGSKTTQSDNFQQWQVTFNPAYAYFKPWWIGTFSFTLMSTATWGVKLDLGPGFCPYYPGLDLDKIFQTRFLIDTYFNMPEAANGITTIAWQKRLPFPGQDYVGNFDGLRQVYTDNNEVENWVQIEKTNETTYSLTNIDLSQSQATMFAVYISICIAVLMASILIIGVVFAINSVYSQIVIQVASTGKYAQIESKVDQTQAQPLMAVKSKKGKTSDKQEVNPEEDDDSNTKKDKKGPPKEISSGIEISLAYNPGRLFYQLFVLAPPLSAFVDYLCVLLTKQYINSAHEFFTHLFREVKKQAGEDADDGLHDLTTESMLGNDMKTLYEKFCYLNGFLEQKLDDPDNLKALKDKGFKIELKEDTQTESYINVMLNGEMPKITPVASKDSLSLFIEKCCKLSTFEEDNIVVKTFDEQYDQFITLNHLEKHVASADEMTKQYNIVSKYIPQQWVVRDDSQIAKPATVPDPDASIMIKINTSIDSFVSKITPQGKNFVIDRQKMQNHFSLLLNHPEQIATPAELATANTELILFGGWYIVDAITVVAHLITTIVFIIPVFGFTLLERILYSPFSLIPQQYLITLEDVISNYWLLPMKLYHESTPIKIVLLVIAIYWIYSLVDLLYYYISMQFPQENFFKKVDPNSANILNKLFRRTMWTLVLISAFQLCVYITLAAVWLMLGAIVNPTAFLPYATAAATFVTVMTAKAAAFKEMSSSGFQKIIEYVKGIAAGQMGGMMKKMDLKGKVDDAMNSSALQGIAGQAASMGLIDPDTMKHLQENADAILKNPAKAAEQVGGELSKIVSDPGAFAAEIVAKLEAKALSLIQDQMAKQFKGYGDFLSNVVLAILKKDQTMFKNNMTQLIYAVSKEIPEVKTMGPPVINMVFAFAYPQQGTDHEDYLTQFMQPTVECLAGLVQQELKDLKVDGKELSIVLNNSITLYRNMTAKKYGAVFTNFSEILDKLASTAYPEIKELKKYSSFLEVAMSLFNENGISFHSVFDIIKKFVPSIDSMKQFKDLLGMFEILVNIFKKQQKSIPTKIMRNRIHKAMKLLITQVESLNVKLPANELALLNNSSVITLFFNFISGHFDKIPKDMLDDIFKHALDKNNSLKKMVSSDKEVKKLSKLMGGVLEMVSLFMEDHHELSTSLHQSALAFSIEDKKAEQLNELFALKYLPQTTYEGSPAQIDAFKRLKLNPLVIQIAQKLRLNTKVTIGIFAQLMGYHSYSSIPDLQQLISKINNSDPAKIGYFFQILILYTSQNETHLANAAIHLSIPREYIPLILLSRRVLDHIYVSNDTLKSLGATKSINQRPNDLSGKEFKIWIDLLTSEIITKEDNLIEGGNTRNLKRFLVQDISQAKGLINSSTVMKLLAALGNNTNKFAKLTQNDIDLLQKILSLKNIEVFGNTGTLSSDTKQAIYSFAQILNVSENKMEDLINIFFVSNPERVVQSIQNSAPDEKSQFFATTETKQAAEYIEFIFSHQEKITKKRSFIQNGFKEMFPVIKLPTAMNLKLLFSKDQQIDINSFYQLAFLVIGKNSDDQIPQETLPALNKVISFLTSTLNTSSLDSLKEQLEVVNENGEVESISDGQATLICMLNENSQNRALTVFLNYIQAQSKKDKNDDIRTLPQAFHLFSVLYLFFTGIETNLKITIEQAGKEPKQYNVLQYLSHQMDIKPEFFESLHTYFLQDNQSFTNVMVKYMRRLEACLFEAGNPGVKIPLQSLVKIPDQFVLNFINLITGQAYSTSFFAKELDLDQNLVDFVAMMMKLQNPKTSQEEKSQCLTMLSSPSSQVNLLLKNLGVKGNELSNLFLLVFQEYDTQNLLPIMKGLGQEDKSDQEVLIRNFLAIDQVIKNDSDLKVSGTQINLCLHDNKLLDQMKVSVDDVIIAKALIQGQFGLTERFMRKQWQHLQYPDCAPKKQEYASIIVGLIGSISGNVSPAFSANQFTRDLYQKFQNKPISDSDPKLFQPSNEISYAFYGLARQIQVDPWILMLSQGIPSAWSALQEIYYTIQDGENEFLNPILVLQALLTFQSVPPVLKEVLTEYEWIQKQIEIMNDPVLKAYLKLNDIENDQYWTGSQLKEEVQKIKTIVFGSLTETEESMKDAAKMVGISLNIFELFDTKDEDIATSLNKAIQQTLKDFDASYEIFPSYGFKSFSEGYYLNQYCEDIAAQMQLDYRDTEKLNTFQQAVESFKSTELDEAEQAIFYSIIHESMIIKVYKAVSNLFTDPRSKSRINAIDKQNNVEAYISFNFLDAPQTPYFNMGVCTTLSTLKKAYWECGYNVPRGDDEHYKIVATHLDYVFTTIERYYHFRGFMDFFSKARAFQIVGLAVGFTFTAEDMIQANCNAPFVSYSRANDLYEKMICKPSISTVDKQKWKWGFIQDNILKDRTLSSTPLKKLFKVFKYDAMVTASNTDISDLENDPENYIRNSVQTTLQFDLEDYIFDMCGLTASTDLNKCARYNGQRQKSSADQRKSLIETYIINNCKNQMVRKNQEQKLTYEQALSQQQIMQQTSNRSQTKPDQPIAAPELLKANLKNIIDVRSGCSWEKVIDLQQKWQITSSKDNYKLLIDIFKGNYDTILEPDTYFTDYYPQYAALLYGILALNGAYYKVQRGWKMNQNNQLSQYLNSCCWNTGSNIKNVAEILSITFRCFDGMPAMASFNENDLDLFNNFVKLSCNLASNPSQQKDFLQVIISKLTLTEKDQTVLCNLINTYMGDYNEYAKLAQYSSFITKVIVKKFKAVNLSSHMGQKRGKKQVEDSAMHHKAAPEDKPAVQVKEAAKEPGAKKDGKGKPIVKIGGKQKKVKEVESTENKYYNVKKLLNKILYGFNESDIHKLEKIDPQRFNFIMHSNLSIDQEENENQFQIVLWQLACSLTRETISEELGDKLTLPLISEAESLNNDEEGQTVYAADFHKKKGYVQACLKILTNLIKDDYAFFFEDSDNLKDALRDLTLVVDQKELDFTRAMIGLKTNKMTTILHQLSLSKKSKIDTKFEIVNIEQQIDQLYKSKIIFFQIKDRPQESEALCRGVAKLFLGLSSGNVNDIVDSLVKSDYMSASFVLTLSMWKNINYLLPNMEVFFTKQFQDIIFPSLTILPLLIFYQIHEQQDKVKGVPRFNQRPIILSSISILLRKISATDAQGLVKKDQLLLSEQFFDKIHEFQKINKDGKFSWTAWVENVDALSKKFTQYFRDDMRLEAEKEALFLLNFITGKFIVDQFKQSPFLKYILEFYQTGNDLINNPENLVKKNQTNTKLLNSFVPSLSVPLQGFFDPKFSSYIDVFDKFIQLFVFIQIPSSTLSHLDTAHDKKALIGQNQDGQNQDNEPKVQEAVSKEDQEAANAANEKVIKQLLLGILKTTIDALMSSFLVEDQTNKQKQQDMDNKLNSKIQQNNSKQIVQFSNQNQLQVAGPQAPQAFTDPESIKTLIYAVMELLTGFDISAPNISESSEQKKIEILCDIIDRTLFNNLKILQYINTTIIRQFIVTLEAISSDPIKSVTNKGFMTQIMKLIHLISGQDNKSEDAGVDLVSDDKNKNTKKIVGRSNSLAIALPPRVPLVILPMEIIDAMFKLAQEDLTCVPILLKQFKVNDGQIKIVENIIHQVSAMGIFGGKPASMASAGKPKAASSELADLMKKIEEGKATSEDMFKAVDEDKTGSISKQEYNTLARRLGMNLSSHRINEIFASLKKGDNVTEDTLNLAEFTKSMDYLQEKNTNMALESLGISPAILTVALVFLGIILMLIFAFIFLGIQAFALGGTFGAVINSLLPVGSIFILFKAAGGGAGADAKKVDEKTNDDQIGDSVVKSQKIIQSDKI